MYLCTLCISIQVKGSILIVEDDLSFGSMLKKWFERNNFSATLCFGMVAAKEEIRQSDFDIVLSDLRLPDGDGIMLLNWLNERQQTTPVIIMTGYGEVQTAVAAIKLGAFDFLEKPINASLLSQKVEAVFKASKNKSKQEQQFSPKKSTTQNRGTTLRGTSSLAVQMYNHIDLVAPTPMSVMIIGESGTGKEHAARLIHDRSTRASMPFIAVDCGSLSIELAPSELFGHKKGAFTSAIENKTGVFIAASGGTLFLDEIGNLPYGVQVQLLRALQEKKIRPVGTANDISVDVRIVTATNENLEKAIAAGTFREDLYHRLNEFMIQMPPLRKCKEDISLYAKHFIAEANIELNKQIKHLSPEALTRLEDYVWTGNLRELRNVIRRTALFTTGDTITVENLPLLAHTAMQKISSENITPTIVSENEKDQILHALNNANGNKSKAARLLHIDRKTLYNKMHLYKIEL